jgi:hypothetical protein
MSSQQRSKSLAERRRLSVHPCRRAAAICSLLLGTLPGPAHSQFTPAEVSQIQSAIGSRIEALTILGGDYGLAGGTLRSTGKFELGGSSDISLGVTKLGGAGNVGDPQPLGDLGIGWQPRVQGNLGYIESTNHLETAPLQGDINTYKTYGLEFGGGARFWVADALSLAPTLMGLYGHTSDTYTANSAFMQANLPLAAQLGLVNYSVDTWTIRPALNIEYLLRWDRTIFTLSSDSTYYHTQSFSSSNSNVSISGNSSTESAKLDIDIPLGRELFGHELRTGGFFSYSALSGGLETGLGTGHLNEVHGRVVLDFLNELWKVQWMGVGASYIWGTNISGWTIGADVAFRF